MNSRLDDLLSRMRHLEEELETELARRREAIEFVIENRRVKFAQEVQDLQRLHKVGLWRYVRHSRLAVLLTAPIIYAGFLVFVLMDAFLTLYQAVCFPIYGIPRVRRREHMVFDRADLPYLNAIEKLNCFYCSYGNGVASYLLEVAARTEQHWCPIKHARRVVSAHGRYPRFFEFGDAQAYREGLERLRRDYESESGSAATAAQPPPGPAEPPATLPPH